MSLINASASVLDSVGFACTTVSLEAGSSTEGAARPLELEAASVVTLPVDAGDRQSSPFVVGEHLDDDGVTPSSSHAQLYREPAYWSYRFKNEVEYEWLASYSQLRPLLRAILPLSSRILLVGTGNSPLPLDMLADGYCNMVATDIAPEAIMSMRDRLASAGSCSVHLSASEIGERATNCLLPTDSTG